MILIIVNFSSLQFSSIIASLIGVQLVKLPILIKIAQTLPAGPGIINFYICELFAWLFCFVILLWLLSRLYIWFFSFDCNYVVSLHLLFFIELDCFVWMVSLLALLDSFKLFYFIVTALVCFIDLWYYLC
jgi:hypothetical protein